ELPLRNFHTLHCLPHTLYHKHQFVIVYTTYINQSWSYNPFVQPLYLAHSECRISRVEEGDGLSFVLGDGEDLLGEVRSLLVLIPVEDADEICLGNERLVVLAEFLRTKLRQRPRVADHDVDAPARVLCLEGHCPGHCSRGPNMGKVHALEEVLENYPPEFVRLNNRDDLTAQL